MLKTPSALYASGVQSGNITNLQELFVVGCVTGLAGLGRHSLREVK